MILTPCAFLHTLNEVGQAATIYIGRQSGEARPELSTTVQGRRRDKDKRRVLSAFSFLLPAKNHKYIFHCFSRAALLIFPTFCLFLY